MGIKWINPERRHTTICLKHHDDDEFVVFKPIYNNFLCKFCIVMEAFLQHKWTKVDLRIFCQFFLHFLRKICIYKLFFSNCSYSMKKVLKFSQMLTVRLTVNFPFTFLKASLRFKKVFSVTRRSRSDVRQSALAFT